MEKRLRGIEVPIEDNTEKIDKVQTQTHALKFPIKDLYEKLDGLAKAAEVDKQKNEAKFEKVIKHVEMVKEVF